MFGQSLLDYALQYAGRGWYVFPTVLRTKRPAIRGWREKSSCNPDIIAPWFDRGKHGIGLDCGRSGLVVLDPDGPEGMAELRRLVGLHSALPRTLTCRTANGWHLYFSGTGVRSTARGKLHVRGEGGLTVLPPTVHPSGKPYCWVDQLAPVASLPDWVRAWRESLGGRPAAAGPDLGTLPTHLAGIKRRTCVLRGETWSSHEEARIRSALARVPADNYEIWTNIGMALCSLGWERPDGTNIGFDIWDEWSQGCQEKYALTALESHWGSFTRSGIGIGTLFHLAGEHGWRGEVKVEESEVMQDQSAVSGLQHKTEPHGEVASPVGPFSSAAGGFSLPGEINGVPALPLSLVERTADRGIVFPDTTEKGRPKASCWNARVAIGGLGIECRYDAFHDKKIVGGRSLQNWVGELSDDVIHVLRVQATIVYGIDFFAQNIRDAAEQLCIQNRFDPVLDYLDSVQWDGVRRIATWLADYMGAPRDALTSEIGRLMLVAAVRRARVPGCKWDHVVVLEGPENRGKSKVLENLAGIENFNDQPILAYSERTQQEESKGVWIYELGELADMRRADAEKVKTFISRTHDRARPAYGRYRVDQPRRCIYVATTNEQTYLKSDTGNRRFWPVRTRRIDADGVLAARDQLWAEAVQAEKAQGWLVLPEALREAATYEQAKRLQSDMWHDKIRDYLADKPDTSISEIVDSVLHMQLREAGQAEVNRIARVLQALGYRRYQRRVASGHQWRYRVEAE